MGQDMGRLTPGAGRGRALRGVAVALLGCAAAPVCAQESFAPPAGCEVIVTAQLANCTVEHLMHCAGDPDGQVTRATMYIDGTVSVAVYDDDGQFVSATNANAGGLYTMRDVQVDPSSLSRLLESGTDDYDEIVDDGDGAFVRYVGQQILTDSAVEIDGVLLDVVRHDFTVFDQNDVLLETVYQSVFLSREWRTAFAGFGQKTTADGEYPIDMTPVEFSLPGEPGYLAAVPTAGCGG